MSSSKFLLHATAFTFLAMWPTAAQQDAASLPNTDFKISKIETTLQDSPSLAASGYDKRVRKPGKWLEIEVVFDWQPRAAEPKYMDDLSVNYFVLLNNKSQEFPAGTLLVGKVDHVSVSQGKDMRSVMFVSPKVLDRFFGGKTPVNVAQAVAGAGAEITVGGTVVAGFATSGRGSDKSRPWAWWDEDAYKESRTPGVLLNKSETPFAALAWDYYEAIKPGSR